MYLPSGTLYSLTHALSERVELTLKREVQLVARRLPHRSTLPWCGDVEVNNGDDAAAIPQPDGTYLLLASDGMRPEFVKADPWFAGWSAVMVNISDIAAMGGRPWAIVDVLYLGGDDGERILDGMRAASDTFGVPVVGGHTCRVDGPSVVSASIIGQARRLIESHGAQPGDALLCAVDLRGSFRGPLAFNAATTTRPADLRRQLGLLPELAEQGLVTAGDISNAGICGTIAMLLEASGTGAHVDVEALCAPDNVDPVRWLTAFPSYGYVLCTRQEHAAQVCERFWALGIACSTIGTITESPWFRLQYGREHATLLDMKHPLTGFGAPVVQWAV